MKKNWNTELRAIIVILAAMLLHFMLSACTTTRYIEVPQVREVVAHQRDTLATHDSIFVRDSICVMLQGDTVVKEKYSIVFRDRWRDRVRVDSFIQRDTVTVIKEVEKPPNRWQQTKMHLGNTLLWMLLASAGYLLIRAIIYRYKRG